MFVNSEEKNYFCIEQFLKCNLVEKILCQVFNLIVKKLNSRNLSVTRTQISVIVKFTTKRQISK